MALIICAGIGRALCYALHTKADSKGLKLFRVFATARKWASPPMNQSRYSV